MQAIGLICSHNSVARARIPFLCRYYPLSHVSSLHATKLCRMRNCLFPVLAGVILNGLFPCSWLADRTLAHAAIKQCMEHGRPEERELFMARGVLQTLSCATKATSFSQLQSARALWALLEPERSKSSKTALVGHFVELLLVCLGKSSKPAFDLLMREYESVLDMDPEFEEMMHGVEAAYFDTGKAAGGLGKMLEGLLGGM